MNRTYLLTTLSLIAQSTFVQFCTGNFQVHQIEQVTGHERAQYSIKIYEPRSRSLYILVLVFLKSKQGLNDGMHCRTNLYPGVVVRAENKPRGGVY